MSQLKGFTFPATAIPADVGTRLKDQRQALSWTQSKLAKRSQIAMGTISKIENFRIVDGVCVRGRRPRASILLRLLGAMYDAGADFELKEIVPDWPEATPGRPFGYGPLSELRRRQLDLSLEQVAAKSKINIATLSRFERNATPCSTLYELRETRFGEAVPVLHSSALAKALGFDTVQAHRDWCIKQERGERRDRNLRPLRMRAA
jgi:transcriptional regulator with XRE-family HTH domain